MRSLPALALALALGLAVLPGCVSKSRYQALEDQLSSAQQRSQQLQAENDRLQQLVQRFQQVAERRLAAFREIVAELKPLVDKGLLEVTVDDGQVVVGMTADVLFPSGSAELSAQGRQTVIKVGQILARRTDRDLQVQGHTDSDPIATEAFADNWHLGAERAMAVVQAMTGAGVPAARLSAATYGPHKPVAGNSSDADKARNRRIEVVIQPDFADLPGFEQLMEAAPTRRPPRNKRDQRDGKRPPR